MRIKEVFSDFDKIDKHFAPIILNRNYSHVRKTEISWANYQTGIPKILYAKEYEKLQSERQYSYLLMDKKGFIQFYYLFGDNEEVKKIKMAYYPYPIELSENEEKISDYFSDYDDELLGEYYYDLWNLLKIEFNLKLSEDEIKYFLDYIKENKRNDLNIDDISYESWLENKYKLTNTSHLRFDYDHSVITHNKFELQFGAINHIRFPKNKIISPLIFFDFIVRNILPDWFGNKTNKGNYLTDYIHSLKNSESETCFSTNNIYLTIGS